MYLLCVGMLTVLNWLRNEWANVRVYKTTTSIVYTLLYNACKLPEKKTFISAHLKRMANCLPPSAVDGCLMHYDSNGQSPATSALYL